MATAYLSVHRGMGVECMVPESKTVMDPDDPSTFSPQHLLPSCRYEPVVQTLPVNPQWTWGQLVMYLENADEYGKPAEERTRPEFFDLRPGDLSGQYPKYQLVRPTPTYEKYTRESTLTVAEAAAADIGVALVPGSPALSPTLSSTAAAEAMVASDNGVGGIGGGLQLFLFTTDELIILLYDRNTKEMKRYSLEFSKAPATSGDLVDYMQRIVSAEDAMSLFRLLEFARRQKESLFSPTAHGDGSTVTDQQRQRDREREAEKEEKEEAVALMDTRVCGRLRRKTIDRLARGWTYVTDLIKVRKYEMPRSDVIAFKEYKKGKVNLHVMPMVVIETWRALPVINFCTKKQACIVTGMFVFFVACGTAADYSFKDLGADVSIGSRTVREWILDRWNPDR